MQFAGSREINEMRNNPSQQDTSDAAAIVPGAARIRVLIVDDQALIRRGLAVTLSADAEIEVVGEASDGQRGLELGRSLRPDIVLMDLIMPKLGGVAATRALISELPNTQVVVLTTFDTDDLVFDAIRAGAQAYLLKDASETELLDTIRAVHRGESRLGANIARKVLGEFRRLPIAMPGDAAGKPPAADLPISPATPQNRLQQDALTKREEEILELIAQGLSNKEIGRTVNLAEGTVKNYVSRIMDKLHARTRTELAVKVVGEKKA
jgi:DNA-binding NarL/FixJ family response regulator